LFISRFVCIYIDIWLIHVSEVYSFITLTAVFTYRKIPNRVKPLVIVFIGCPEKKNNGYRKMIVARAYIK
jgi:hypothetical protein